jgi:hypothetical protein
MRAWGAADERGMPDDERVHASMNLCRFLCAGVPHSSFKATLGDLEGRGGVRAWMARCGRLCSFSGQLDHMLTLTKKCRMPRIFHNVLKRNYPHCLFSE